MPARQSLTEGFPLRDTVGGTWNLRHFWVKRPPTDDPLEGAVMGHFQQPEQVHQHLQALVRLECHLLLEASPASFLYGSVDWFISILSALTLNMQAL